MNCKGRQNYVAISIFRVKKYRYELLTESNFFLNYIHFFKHTTLLTYSVHETFCFIIFKPRSKFEVFKKKKKTTPSWSSYRFQFRSDNYLNLFKRSYDND